MQPWLEIALLYLLGVVLIVADLFLPSHFLLTLSALGVFCYALYLTFQLSAVAGLISIVLLIVLIPTVIAKLLRIWPKTWLGRRIAPPNPVLTERDRLPTAQLERLIGCTGRSLTQLRPVGLCQFEGQRLECVAERGVIEPNVPVECIRLIDRTLCVRPVSEMTGFA